MKESLLLHQEAWHRSARQPSSGESAIWVEEVNSRRVAIDPHPVDVAPDRIAADVHREIQIAVSSGLGTDQNVHTKAASGPIADDRFVQRI